MKKLLTVIILTVSINCIGTPTIKKEETLPTEVMFLREVNKFDTLLSIETEKAIHYFKMNKGYIGSTKKDLGNLFWLGFTIGAVLVLLACVLFDRTV